MFLSLKYNKYNKYIINCHSPNTGMSTFNALVLQLANQKQYFFFFLNLGVEKNPTVEPNTLLWDLTYKIQLTRELAA